MVLQYFHAVLTLFQYTPVGGSRGNKFDTSDGFKFNSNFNTLTWDSSRHIENCGFRSGTLIYRIFMVRNWSVFK